MVVKFKLKFLVASILGLVAYTGYAQQRPMVGPVTIISPSSLTTPLTLQGATGQSSDVLQVQDSVGGVKSRIGSDGSVSGTLKLINPPLASSFLYTTPLGVVTPATSVTFDSANNRIGFFTPIPTEQLQFGATSLFTAPISVTDRGLRTFTIGQVPSTIDIVGPASFNLATARLGTELSTKTSQWGYFLGCHVAVTSSTGSYEKACLFADNEGEDPSNYGSAISRDIVGGDIRGGLRGGVANGRVWGLVTSASVASGADGNAVGLEVDLNNNGSNQGEVDQTTTKAGLTSLSIGANPGTVGVGVFSTSGVTNGWHKAFWSRQSYLIDSFVELYRSGGNTPLFKVFPTGQTVIGDLRNAGSLNNYDPTVYGTLTVGSYMSTLGGGSLNAEKDVLYLFSDSSSSKHRIGTTRYDSGVAYWPLALETAGNEVALLTLDPFVQLTKSYTGGNLSAAGTVALRNNAGALQASQNGGAWATLGSGTVPDCTETSQTIKCLINGTGATYLQVENDTNDTGAQAALVAQSGSGGTLNAIVGATPAMFTPVGPIGASTAYLVGGSGANSLVVEALKGPVTLYGVNGTSGTYTVDVASTATSAALDFQYSTNVLAGYVLGNSSGLAMCHDNPCTFGIGVQTASPTNVIAFAIPATAGNPSSNPSSGVFYFYIDSNDGNKLKVVGSSGTHTTIASP